MNKDKINTNSLLKRNNTGYPSIDKPHEKNSGFFEKNPIIPNTNIYSILKLLSIPYMDNNAVNCWDLDATYRELIKDSATISLALKELGVRKNDIVAVSMPNFYQSICLFFACNRIGAVTTFIDSHASIEEVANYLNTFESSTFIDFDKNEEYNKTIRKNTKVKNIITLRKDNINSKDIFNVNNDNSDLIDYHTLGSISKHQKNKIELPHSKKENSLILFTSGSTGKPKSVVLTNENLLAAEIYAKNTSHTENIKVNKTLTCVPFSYPYGFVTSALTSLLWGKEAILAPDISKDTISYYYKKEPNIIFGSPALLDLTMKNLSDEQDLSFVTHFISGGDFLTPEHAERGNSFFAKHGATNVEIGNGSGNAETVSIGSTPIGVPLRQDTAGKILVGTKVMIVDPETMEEKKCGEVGMLCVSGKHVFKEYYKNEELTKESKFIKNGIEYYKTGTMGIIDNDGYFTVTARQSRFYILSTLNKVYCDNVQNIIATFPQVKDCAVVKVYDKEQLYVNKAYIVLNDKYKEEENILETIRELFKLPSKTLNGTTVQLKSYEIPTYVEFVDDLPRISGSEKIDYKYLETDAEEKLNNSKARVLKKNAN